MQQLKRLALLAVLAHLALTGALWPSVRDSPLTGDEIAYRDGAMALRNAIVDLVQLKSPDSAELQANVIGNGWFMPGPSALLAPLYLVAPDAGLTATRTYLGVLSTLLLLLAAYVVHRSLGPRYAAALLVLPGLIPMWVLFSYTAWGDATCGLLVVLVLASLVRLADRLNLGQAWSIPSGIGFGILLACTLYLRSSALPLVVGCLVLALLGVFVLSSDRIRLKGLGAGLAAAITLIVLVAPWSVAASRTLDDRVTTATSLPLSLAVTFGNQDELCFGPCDTEGSNIFFAAVKYSRQVAAVTGKSELEVQQEMSDQALRGLETPDYIREVADNTERFTLRPNDFLSRVWPDVSVGDWSFKAIEWSTWGLYGVGLVALALGVLVVRRYPVEAQVVSLLVTLMTIAIFLQPLLHHTSGRYWPTFAPLMGVSLALLLGRHRNESGRSSLVAGQAVSLVVLFTTIVVMGLLSI